MSLDSWAASDAVVKDRHLHHGRFGLRWKSSDAAITGNRATRHLTLAVDCDVTMRTLLLSPSAASPCSLFPVRMCTWCQACKNLAVRSVDRLRAGFWSISGANLALPPASPCTCPAISTRGPFRLSKRSRRRQHRFRVCSSCDVVRENGVTVCENGVTVRERHAPSAGLLAPLDLAAGSGNVHGHLITVDQTEVGWHGKDRRPRARERELPPPTASGQEDDGGWYIGGCGGLD